MRQVMYCCSIIEALASQYISSTPAHRRIGHPRKRSHPDSHDLECLNGQLHLLDKQQQHVLSAVTLQVDNGTEQYTNAKCVQTTLVFAQTSVLSVTIH